MNGSLLSRKCLWVTVAMAMMLCSASFAALTVTVNQGSSQYDPTPILPIKFVATFSGPVTGFDANDADDQDVIFTGDATVTAYTVASISPDNSRYSIEVTAVHGYGSIFANVPANICPEGNDASTSTDNNVDYAMRRILVVGDSWAHMPTMHRSLRTALKEVGLGQFCEEGTKTAIATNSTVKRWAQNYQGCLDALHNELLAYPCIDIAHVSLGGNDFLGDWEKEWTLQEETDFFLAIIHNMEIVLDYILAQNPYIRVAWSGYDYMREPEDDAWPQQVNEAGLRFSALAMQMLATKGPRVVYINNYGSAQYYLGETFDGTAYGPSSLDIDDPYLIPPDYTAFATPYAPFTVPEPTGPYDNPPYGNMPGGDPTLLSPLPAMLRPALSGDIHFNKLGYDLLARNCVKQVYRHWLAWPRVYSIERIGEAVQDSGEVQFLVTFSEPVFSVDASDFVVNTSLGKDLQNIYISDIDGNGSNEILVTIDATGYTGPISLQVVDHDSIVDADSNPLGGEGDGNGDFAISSTVNVHQVPVSPWPAALLILLAAAGTLRRAASRA